MKENKVKEQSTTTPTPPQKPTTGTPSSSARPRTETAPTDPNSRTAPPITNTSHRTGLAATGTNSQTQANPKPLTNNAPSARPRTETTPANPNPQVKPPITSTRPRTDPAAPGTNSQTQATSKPLTDSAPANSNSQTVTGTINTVPHLGARLLDVFKSFTSKNPATPEYHRRIFPFTYPSGEYVVLELAFAKVLVNYEDCGNLFEVRASPKDEMIVVLYKEPIHNLVSLSHPNNQTLISVTWTHEAPPDTVSQLYSKFPSYFARAVSSTTSYTWTHFLSGNYRARVSVTEDTKKTRWICHVLNKVPDTKDQKK